MHRPIHSYAYGQTYMAVELRGEGLSTCYYNFTSGVFQHTHELKVHQLRVKVEGWRELIPVSMDKVGTYFRMAQADASSTVIH